ncbi:MAG: hypothetical protein ACSLE9_07475 [Burkholderiaceae bacterium]
MPRLPVAAIVLATALLAGCDMLGGALGIESPEKVAAAREAEGKAIGGACRNAARAIEDCFALNRKADKAAVFAGWREMNDYMRENKIDPVAPQLVTKVAGAKAVVTEADSAAEPAPVADKPAAKVEPGKPRAQQGGKAQDS